MGAALGSAKPEDCTSWLTFSTDCPGCAGATVNQTTIIEELGSPFVYSKDFFANDFHGPGVVQFPIGLTALWERNHVTGETTGECDFGINVTDPWPPILQCPRDLEVSRAGGSVDFNGTAGVLFTPPGDEVLVTLQRPTVIDVAVLPVVPTLTLASCAQWQCRWVPGSSGGNVLYGPWRINPYSRTMECVLDKSDGSTGSGTAVPCRAYESEESCNHAIEVWSRDARFSDMTLRCPKVGSPDFAANSPLVFRDVPNWTGRPVACDHSEISLGCSDVSKPLGVDIEQRKMSYFAGVDIGGIDIIRAWGDLRGLYPKGTTVCRRNDFAEFVLEAPQYAANDSVAADLGGACLAKYTCWVVTYVHSDGPVLGSTEGPEEMERGPCATTTVRMPVNETTATAVFSASDDSGHVTECTFGITALAPPLDLSGGYFDPQPTYQRGAALTASNTLPAVGSAAVTFRVTPWLSMDTGLALDAATGAISGTPTKGDAGGVSCTWHASVDGLSVPGAPEAGYAAGDIQLCTDQAHTSCVSATVTGELLVGAEVDSERVDTFRFCGDAGSCDKLKANLEDGSWFEANGLTGVTSYRVKADGWSCESTARGPTTTYTVTATTSGGEASTALTVTITGFCVAL